MLPVYTYKRCFAYKCRLINNIGTIIDLLAWWISQWSLVLTSDSLTRSRPHFYEWNVTHGCIPDSSMNITLAFCLSCHSENSSDKTFIVFSPCSRSRGYDRRYTMPIGFRSFGAVYTCTHYRKTTTKSRNN